MFLQELRQRWRPDAEADLEERWRDIARSKQLPPDGDWFVWLLQTGRGWGKTRSAGEWFHDRGMSGGIERRMLLVGRTPADVRDYALNGHGGLLTHHGDQLKYEPSKRRIEWPTGAVALIRSGANPEEFRGFSGDTIWLDEFCAWQYPSQSWENIMLGAREGSPKICISTTPKPIKVLQQIKAMERVVVVRGSTLENEGNLADEYIDNVVRPMLGTRRGRQEIKGEVLEDVEGALWSGQLIEQGPADRETGGRIVLPEPMPPQRLILWLFREHDIELVRLAIGVDPSGGGNDVGIVVAGKGPCGFCGVDDHHGFVLGDDTCEARGAKWGEDVVESYDRWGADRVFGEKNYGGAMVENTIRTVEGGENISYEDVSASRGKTVRAEPVASLYEQGKVHHVGMHELLEEELTGYVEGESDWSPNRMDGLVWVLTKLFDLEERKKQEKPKPKAKVFGPKGSR